MINLSQVKGRQVAVVLQRVPNTTGAVYYRVAQIRNALKVDCARQDGIVAEEVGVDWLLTEAQADNICRCAAYQTTVLGVHRA